MQDILSARMGRIDVSAIRRVFDLAESLKDPINLSIGQPHYPAPERVRKALADAALNGQTAYTKTQGIQPLREALARKYTERNRIETTPDQVLVSSGVASLIQLLMLATIDPGDRVLLTDPAFLIYRSMLDFYGAEVVTIPETFTTEELDAVDTAGVKLVIYCSPSNPTGFVMDANRIRALAGVADKNGAVLVADEIYELFDYDGAFVSAGSIYENTLTLSGFSKSYNMTGLRLSYATGPAKLLKAMTTLQQYTVVCAPSAVQWAGLAALDEDMSPYVDAYRRNRDRCIERLQGKMNFTHPGGAFYIFPELPGEDADDFAFVERAIKEKQLLLVPGHIFTESRRYLRLSYAAEPDVLERGLDGLVDLLG